MVQDGIYEVKRELAMREKVYPGLIRNGLLTEVMAAKHIRSMTAVLHFLEKCLREHTSR